MTLEFDDFKEKFGAWAEAFRPFIESEAMFKLFDQLKKDARTERIYPSSDNTFRTFSTTHPDSLEVVWFLMDPYPKVYPGKPVIPHATGIAMDCSNSPDGRLQPSLEKFYEGMARDIGKMPVCSPSLLYLQQQGVMMTNTALTVKFRKTGSHKKIWLPFQQFFLEEVLRGKRLIYILSGEASWEMEKWISPLGNVILKTEHPVAASYSKRDWDSRDLKTKKSVFTLVNDILQEEGKMIYWDKADFETMWCPF